MLCDEIGKKKENKGEQSSANDWKQEVLDIFSFIGISLCLIKPNVVSEVTMVFHSSEKYFNN